MSAQRSKTRRRLALVLILFASLVINIVGLSWGLPNGNQTWSSDALNPLTPMAVSRHVLFGDGWNSGWFYFKYPVGHPLLVLAAQAPLLAAQWFSGELRHPSSVYPFGFKHPETSLARLAMISRVVSALMGVGVVWCAYITASLLFDSLAGLLSAVCVAGCYPMVFYAHTSNVDMPALFWIAAAYAAVLWSALRGARAGSVVTGISAAWAMLTKEQAIGALAALPVVWLLARTWHGRRDVAQSESRRLSRRGLSSDVLRHFSIMAAVFALTTVVVANVAWNPSGYMNRWRFLLGSLSPEVRARYAPYQFMIQVPKQFSLAHELEKIGKVARTVAHGLTWPITVLSVAGAVAALLRAPRAFLMIFTSVVAYYALSLRALELIPVRYTMPLLYFLLLPAGFVLPVALAALHRGASRARPALALATAVVVVVALLPGVDVTRLLVNDPRYAAEAWLQQQATPQPRIEVYQPATYLPRFATDWQVKRIPVAERSAAAFAERQPDFVVLSSGGKAGLTGRYAKNWQPGQAVFSDSQAAQQFFESLRSGQLGYRRAAEFQTKPLWITPRINSLNPSITVYGREPATGSRERGIDPFPLIDDTTTAALLSRDSA